MADIGQFVAFRTLVADAKENDLRLLVPAPARNLLLKLRPEQLAGDQLRQFVLGARTLREYLEDDGTRRAVLNLLDGDQAAALARRLGIDKQPAAEALAASADGFTRADLSVALDFFGAISENRRGTAAATPGVVGAKAGYALFPHQRATLRRVQTHLYGGQRRVVLHMPTGAGKTRTAMNIIAEHLRAHDPAVAVWLAYSQELLEQAASEFEAAWGHLGNREVELIRFWGSREADLKAVNDGLVVAGLGKLYAAHLDDINLVPCLADAATLVVFDEAHQSTARTYEYLLKTLGSKNPNSSLLGLTATPGRTYSDIDEDARLAALWGKNKVTLEVPGHGNPVRYLIDEGYLARPEFKTVNVTPGLQLEAQDIARLESTLDVPEDILARLGEDELWNLSVVRTTEELLERHRRVIVFATSVRQAVLLGAVLRACGHVARTITGATPQDERESMLRLYSGNSPEPIVLFNYGVLTTGFDAPSTSAAVIARPTRSLVLYSQMIGRALRGRRAGGNETAEIVTVLDPRLPGFGDPAEAFFNWEDVW